MIMVAAGTGVVPFIGFLQERMTDFKEGKGGDLGEAHLFFGCREKNTDFIYRDTFDSCLAMKEADILSSFALAESRPQQSD